jgi:NADH-quinone oxidoreductase subunit H
VYFVVKVALVIFVIVWVRVSLPRIRYDKLMQFCWKFLLPLSILNLAVTAVGVVLIG